MKRKKHSGFTLVEVIFSIALLSIVSVVILNLYIASGELNDKALIQNMASLMASNAIEEVRSTPRDLPESITLYYDEYWALSDKSAEASYTLNLSVTKDETVSKLVYLDVIVTDSESKTIVNFSTGHYLQSGGGQ